MNSQNTQGVRGFLTWSKPAVCASRAARTFDCRQLQSAFRMGGCWSDDVYMPASSPSCSTHCSHVCAFDLVPWLKEGSHRKTRKLSTIVDRAAADILITASLFLWCCVPRSVQRFRLRLFGCRLWHAIAKHFSHFNLWFWQLWRFCWFYGLTMVLPTLERNKKKVRKVDLE